MDAADDLRVADTHRLPTVGPLDQVVQELDPPFDQQRVLCVGFRRVECGPPA